MPAPTKRSVKDVASNDAVMLVAVVGDIRKRQEFIDVLGSVESVIAPQIMNFTVMHQLM